MKFKFTFNEKDWDCYRYDCEFMMEILERIDDPTILYKKGYFMRDIEDGYEAEKIDITFTEFLQGKYDSVIYTKFDVELNLSEDEGKLYKELLEEKRKKLDTEVQKDLISQILKSKGGWDY
jgi:hypothetical protein